MIHDSVREELKTKASLPLTPIDFEKRAAQHSAKQAALPAVETPVKTESNSRPITARLTIKPTSPTLVEFHNKNAAVPEWRLQLQNAVRQRQDKSETETKEPPAPAAVSQKKLVTHGATAMKAEVVQRAEPTQHKNSTLSSALERIEKSRQQFLTEEVTEISPVNQTSAPAANKNFPFYIAAKQNEADPPSPVKASVNPPVRPKLATAMRTEINEPVHTNKLPSLPEPAKISSSFADRPVEIGETSFSPLTEEASEPAVEIIENPITETAIEVKDAEEVEIEEADDLAPFAMRFNAGLFDFIIGAFTSLILLSPFMIRSETWFTFSGFLTFLTTCAVIMFAYLTVAIGFFGRTVGMRIFSLEVIDIDGENYPTIHQAAVSSSVYLLSLACGGIGFLTLFFNEEKRAAHDLISKTIIVREF